MANLFTVTAESVDRNLSSSLHYQRLFVEPNRVSDGVLTREGYDEFGATTYPQRTQMEDAKSEMMSMVGEKDDLGIVTEQAMCNDIARLFGSEKEKIERSARLNKLNALLKTAYGPFIAAIGIPLLGIAPLLAVPVFVAGGGLAVKGMIDYVREPSAESVWMERYQKLRENVLYVNK